MQSTVKSQTTEHTIPVSQTLSLRLYSDTKPHNYRIARLQKGLILVYHESELVGEGAGLGAPVARYRDKTYFSGSSAVQVSRSSNRTILTKKFILNMVSEKRFKTIKIENLRTRRLAIKLDELYQRHRHFRFLPLAGLSRNLGINTKFVQVEPRGSIVVAYSISSSLINVNVDFKSLKKNGLQEIFLLNEQGASFFERYHDSNGTILLDEQIGAWDNVEAEWACLSDKDNQVGFRLRKVENVVLRRGREFLDGIFDWAGLDYEVHSKKSEFEYNIEVFGSQGYK